MEEELSWLEFVDKMDKIFDAENKALSELERDEKPKEAGWEIMSAKMAREMAKENLLRIEQEKRDQLLIFELILRRNLNRVIQEACRVGKCETTIHATIQWITQEFQSETRRSAWDIISPEGIEAMIENEFGSKGYQYDKSKRVLKW